MMTEHITLQKATRTLRTDWRIANGRIAVLAMMSVGATFWETLNMTRKAHKNYLIVL